MTYLVPTGKMWDAGTASAGAARAAEARMKIVEERILRLFMWKEVREVR